MLRLKQTKRHSISVFIQTNSNDLMIIPSTVCCALYLWVWDESYKKARTQDDTVYCVLYLWVWDESYKKASTQNGTVHYTSEYGMSQIRKPVHRMVLCTIPLSMGMSPIRKPVHMMILCTVYYTSEYGMSPTRKPEHRMIQRMRIFLIEERRDISLDCFL